MCSTPNYCPEGSSSEATCSAGYYCPNTTSIVVCPAGYYCEEGSQEPIVCPSSYYCEEGSSVPVECDEGASCTGGTSSQLDCIAGYENIGNATHIECWPCQERTYNPDVGGECVYCNTADTVGQTYCEFIACFDLNECSGHGKCVDEVCSCYSGWNGTDCSTKEAVIIVTSEEVVVAKTTSVAVVTATVVVATTTAVSSATSTASVGASSATSATSIRAPAAASAGLVMLFVFLQGFILPLQHNDELSDVFAAFETLKYSQLNFGSDSGDSEDQFWSFAHGLSYKLMIGAAAAVLSAILPGYTVALGLFQMNVRHIHFVVILLLIYGPITESVFEVSSSLSVSFGSCVAVILALGCFLYLYVHPYVEDEDGKFKSYIVPGRGFSGLFFTPYNTVYKQLEKKQKEADPRSRCQKISDSCRSMSCSFGVWKTKDRRTQRGMKAAKGDRENQLPGKDAALEKLENALDIINLGHKQRDSVPVWKTFAWKVMFESVVCYHEKSFNPEEQDPDMLPPYELGAWEVKYLGGIRGAVSHYFMFIKLMLQVRVCCFH